MYNYLSGEIIISIIKYVIPKNKITKEMYKASLKDFIKFQKDTREEVRKNKHRKISKYKYTVICTGYTYRMFWKHKKKQYKNMLKEFGIKDNLLFGYETTWSKIGLFYKNDILKEKNNKFTKIEGKTSVREKKEVKKIFSLLKANKVYTGGILVFKGDQTSIMDEFKQADLTYCNIFDLDNIEIITNENNENILIMTYDSESG